MSAVTAAGRIGRGSEVLPDEAYAAALLSLPGLWPARLAALLGIGRSGRPEEGARKSGQTEGRGSARTAWALVRAGRAADRPAVRRLLREANPEAIAALWASAASRVDVGAAWSRYRRLGVRVDIQGDPGYPDRLADDPSAPYVLFRYGANSDLAGRTVAIVGTRRCTPGGREIATELGNALAARGVRVVSGLALGIDAAAHEGALASPGAAPVGVVAGGLDRPYPVRHRTLWQRVGAAGVLMTEWPLGTMSEGWRFPARNRLIVAVSEVVVVVESRESGGSLLTAQLAMERGVPVLAVPGSIRSPAAAGTNRLLRDGASPACGVDDVLTALSLEPCAVTTARDRRPAPRAEAAGVLAAMGWEPVSTDALAARTRLSPPALAVLLAHLELDGWVAGGSGWWQQIGPRG
jgi:DNA processing protein